MRIFLLALQFLTIIPIRIKGIVGENEVGRSSLFFPLVGAVQGAMLSLAAILLATVFPPSVLSGILVSLLIIVTGGFHVDGLADTFDGLSVKSTGDRERDRQKRLSVMKDPTTGAVGVTAIVLSILLKYLFIDSILGSLGMREALFCLFLMPVLSKWSMVAVMCHGKAARDEGLGKMFVSGTTPSVLVGASIVSAAVCLIAGLWLLNDTIGAITFFLVSFFVLYVFSVIWNMLCRRRFGGLTGDNIGAMSEISDILFLSAAYLILKVF